MSAAPSFSAPSGRKMFADYECDTSGTVKLLTALRESRQLQPRQKRPRHLDETESGADFNNRYDLRAGHNGA